MGLAEMFRTWRAVAKIFFRETNKAKSAEGSGTRGGVQRKLGQLASAFPVKSRRTQSIGPVTVTALEKWLPPRSSVSCRVAKLFSETWQVGRHLLPRKNPNPRLPGEKEGSTTDHTAQFRQGSPWYHLWVVLSQCTKLATSLRYQPRAGPQVDFSEKKNLPFTPMNSSGQGY